jgi:acetyltransferase-like isoleucine patch superfamily enzyme
MAVPIAHMVTIGLLPSRLKVAYYRWKGAVIGRDVSIGLLSVIRSERLEIGEGTKIGPFSFVQAKRVRLGKRVKINMMVAVDTLEVEVGDDATIMEQVVVGGMLTRRSSLRIGKRVKIFPYCFINPTEPVVIEDDVGVGGASYIFTHGSWQSMLDGFPVSFGPVTLKRGVWLPWRVFILPKVTVGEYATIGAGAVINKDVPPRSLAAGVPARVLKHGPEYIRDYTQDQQDEMLLKILQEFCEHQTFFGSPATLTTREAETEIEIQRRGQRIKVLYRRAIEEDVAGDVLISLQPMSAATVQTISRKRKMWFDIGAKKSEYRSDPLWIELRDFFSRYGIRFDLP